jgi:predicted enzyme related to lactoylglutathione lyase
VGTSDLGRAAAFYDELFAVLGATRMFETPRGVFWTKDQGPFFGVVRPFNEQAATFGNGTVIGFEAESDEVSARVHALALRLGGQDEGAPGPRASGWFCAYFRDLDGNKLNVYHRS